MVRVSFQLDDGEPYSRESLCQTVTEKVKGPSPHLWLSVSTALMTASSLPERVLVVVVWYILLKSSVCQKSLRRSSGVLGCQTVSHGDERSVRFVHNY